MKICRSVIHYKTLVKDSSVAKLAWASLGLGPVNTSASSGPEAMIVFGPLFVFIQYPFEWNEIIRVQANFVLATQIAKTFLLLADLLSID